MAEALTVIGGLAAVAQLSTYAARSAREFYCFARGVKGVTTEVNRFANQVQSFSYIVDLAQVTLSRYCSESPESRVVAYLSSHRVLPNINSDARYTSRHIRAIRDRLRRTPTRFAFVTAIVWWFCKPSVMELYPEMESIKANLSLLMTTTLLEARLQSASSLEQGNTRLREEMNILKRMLKTQMETLQNLNRQLNRKCRVNGIQQTDSFSPAHQDVLLDLGWSMYEDDVVPDPLPISPSVSKQNLRSDASASSSSDGPNEDQAWGSEADSTISSRSTPSSRRPSVSSSSPTAVEPRNTQPEPSPEAVQLAAPSQSPGPLTTNSIPPPSSLHVPTSPKTAINGYIIPTGPRHINTLPGYATAFLVPDLPINIISLASAGRHNVDIQWLLTNSTNNINSTNENAENDAGGDGGGVVLLDFGNGRRPERIIGRATIHWSRSSQRHNAYYMYHQHPPPLLVECEVCENSEVGLIFGKPFVDEREKRWRGRGD